MKAAIAFILAGLLATITLAQQPTTQATETIILKLEEEKVQLRYPSDWEDQGASGKLVAQIRSAAEDGDNHAAINLQIEPSLGPDDAKSLAAIMKALTDSYKKRGKVIETSADKLGKLTARTLLVELPLEDKRIIRSRMTVAVKNKKMYILTYGAGQKYFDKHLSEAKEIIKSFEIAD